MRSAAEVWEACADDERWLDDPAAMVAEIQREAFASGVEAAALQIERVHVHMPQCAWTMPRALVRAVRELNGVAEPEPASDEGAKLDMDAGGES